MTCGFNEGVAKAWSRRKPLPRAPPFSFEYQVYSVIPGLWCRHISVQPSVANRPECSAHTNVLPVSSKERPERTARTDAAALSGNPGKGCAITCPLRFRPNRSFSMPPRCRVTFFDNRHQIYRSLLIDSALPLVAAERALAWLAERHVLPEDLGHRSRSSTSARRNKAFLWTPSSVKVGCRKRGSRDAQSRLHRARSGSSGTSSAPRGKPEACWRRPLAVWIKSAGREADHRNWKLRGISVERPC